MGYARVTRTIGIALVTAASAAAPTAQTTQTARTARTAQNAYDAQATQEWRTKRETSLKAPDGWLSVAGLFFLHPGANTLGSDPASDIALPAGAAPERAGRVRFENGKIVLELEPGVKGTLNDQPITGPVELRGPDEAQKRPEDLAHIGRLTLLRHLSGERAAIRLKDPESPIRRDFTGVKWYPIDPKWSVTGTWEPFKERRKLQVQNVLGDIDQETASGEVTVTVGGQTVKLLPIDASNGRLWFVFSDALAGTENYRIRFVYADAPKDGKVTIDFNRAYNPPCAYNPYTTCPLPPPQNRLKVPIRAGERAYGHPVPAAIPSSK